MLWKQTSDVMETLTGEGCTKEAGPAVLGTLPEGLHTPSLLDSGV
jgi:hypothetical protein